MAMKRFVLIFILAGLFFNSEGQVNKHGVPFVKTYPTQTIGGSEEKWCFTKDIFGNLYVGDQERGVILYDGTKWTVIEIRNSPRIHSLAADSRGIVYVGGAYEFGYIQPDEQGSPEYVTLTGRVDSIPEIQDVRSIALSGDDVYFQGTRNLFIYNSVSDSLQKIDLTQYGVFATLRLVKINDKLVLSDNNLGLLEVKDGKIVPLKGGGFFEKMPCTVLLPFDDSSILVGTYFNGLYLYDYNTGIVRDDFVDRSLNEKFKTIANIYSGARISDDLFAIGTTSQEGVLVFNRSGKLIYQLTKETSDLVDDAILALYCDHSDNSELWIATLGFLNKAYFNIPITVFSEKQGIDYAVNDLAEFQGNIYISSDAGVLKSYIDRNNTVRFRKLPDIEGQYIPLEYIKTSHDEFLLTGSNSGIRQILRDDAVIELEKNIRGLTVTLWDYKKILQSAIDRDIVFIGLASGGILVLRDEGGHWRYLNRIRGFPGLVSSMVEKKEGGLWFLSEDPSALFSLSFNGTDTTLVRYGVDKGVPEIKTNMLCMINEDLYLTTAEGLFRYDRQNDRFNADNSLTAGFTEGKTARYMFADSDGDIWSGGFDLRNFEMLSRQSPEGVMNYNGVLNLLPNVALLDMMESDKRIYLTKSKVLSVLDKSGMLPDTTKVNTRFTSIVVGNDSVVMNGFFHSNWQGSRRLPQIYYPAASVPEYSYDMNEITFEWTTPYFVEEMQTEYSYKLEGYDEKWSVWQGISFGFTQEAIYSKKEYANLPYGHYTFYVKSRTLTGLEGKELKFEFAILKPWYATTGAFIGYVLAAILLIWGIIAAYTKRLKNENIRLEGIVRERTAVVVKQKEELESSIHYAKRIQMALLPSQSILTDNIKENFILFRPRDIVSGDFYWMTKKGSRLYIVAADCTGHGVPGAFMSLLGMSFIDEIIDKEDAPRADFILNELRLQITESLKQSGGDDEAKDGMDMGLLVVDYGTNRIEFSGAYNPCFRVRKLSEEEARKISEDPDEKADGSMSNGKYILETIFASKMPIGISSRMNEQFVFCEWELERGVSYYMSSDGYIDQFGGDHGRKFMKKNFKRLILEIQDHPMETQRELLEKNLLEWMGPTPQIDDILVLGIKL